MSNNKNNTINYMLTGMRGILQKESELLTISEKSELLSFIDKIKAEFLKLEYEIPDENYGIKILEQQENERQRIARELHDSTIQVLTNLVHKSELCMKVMDNDPIRAKLELEIINNNLRFTINDLRNIIHNLRPMAFDDFGLDVTLDRVVNQIRNCTDILIHLDIIGNKVALSSVQALTLVRIIQEACSNSIKHSRAENIYIEFSYLVNHISLIIRDDGIGFNAEEVDIAEKDDYTGFGISIMKERAILLSGIFNIISELNEGTKVTVLVPIQ